MSAQRKQVNFPGHSWYDITSHDNTWLIEKKVSAYFLTFQNPPSRILKFRIMKILT